MPLVPTPASPRSSKHLECGAEIVNQLLGEDLFGTSHGPSIAAAALRGELLQAAIVVLPALVVSNIQHRGNINRDEG